MLTNLCPYLGGVHYQSFFNVLVKELIPELTSNVIVTHSRSLFSIHLQLFMLLQY